MKMELKEKLNLGSGNEKLEGYTNIDSDPTCNPDIIGNALNLDMIKNESVNELFCEHLLEHFDIKEIDILFEECRRILKPNGKLVIIAPDMKTVLDIYFKKECDIDYLDLFLFAHHRLRKDCHMQGMYKSKLQRLCQKHRFKITSLIYQNRLNSRYEIKVEAIKED